MRNNIKTTCEILLCRLFSILYIKRRGSGLTLSTYDIKCLKSVATISLREYTGSEIFLCISPTKRQNALGYNIYEKAFLLFRVW